MMKKRFLFLTIISAFVSVAQAQSPENTTRERSGAPQEPNAQVRHYSDKGNVGQAVNQRAERVDTATATARQRYAQGGDNDYRVTERAYAQEKAPAVDPQIEAEKPVASQVSKREKELNASYASARKQHSKVVSEVKNDRKQIIKEFESESKVLKAQIVEARKARDAKLEELDRAEVKLKETYAHPLAALNQIMEDNSQVNDSLVKLRGEGEAELQALLENVNQERKAVNATYDNVVDASNFELQLLEDAKLEKETVLNEKLEESKTQFDERKKEHFRSLAREKKRQAQNG